MQVVEHFADLVVRELDGQVHFTQAGWWLGQGSVHRGMDVDAGKITELQAVKDKGKQQMTKNNMTVQIYGAPCTPMSFRKNNNYILSNSPPVFNQLSLLL